MSKQLLRVGYCIIVIEVIKIMEDSQTSGEIQMHFLPKVLCL